MIAWGTDHFVYDYGPDQVIKFSIFDFLLGKDAPSKLQREYAVGKKFFGQYLLDSPIVFSANGRRIAVIQKKITGRYLTKSDLDRPAIKKQFEEIARGFYTMMQEGYKAIDLVGRGGVFSPVLSNILVTKNDKLVIIDTTLLDPSYLFFWKIPIAIIFKMALWRNKQLMKDFSARK